MLYKGSSIDVYFKQNEFYPTVRQRQLTEIDYLSYIGGTLGLFAGFSILTFLELFFYFIFRPAVRCMKKKFKSRVAPIEVIGQSTKTSKGVLKPVRYFYNYMEESSLHGLNHATFKNLEMIERAFWLFAFVASMILCGFLLENMHDKYINAPVTISFDGDMKSVKDVSRKIELIE
jgi:hypothetical protein